MTRPRLQGRACVSHRRGAGNRLLPQLHSARKLACTKLTDASFKCDVELEVTAPGAAQRSKAPANFTFTKRSERWTTNLR